MPIISKTGSHRLKKTVTPIETTGASVEYLQTQIDNLKDAFIRDFEGVAENYIRVNQSFEEMYFDNFSTNTKTDPSYIDKVNTNYYKMVPESGEWRSKMWVAAATVTMCKLQWKADADTDVFNYDIEISADNGSNWTTISSGGSENNKDKEVVITNPGTQVILRVLNGDNGFLENYILLVK